LVFEVKPSAGAVMTVYQGTSFTPELTATGYALFRAGVKVSAGTVDDLAGSLRRRHERNRTRWRLLSPLAQAVLVIAFLRTNLTYTELAAGFGISQSTCWRNVAEGIGVLADRGRRISLADVARLAVKMGWDYLIVDGVHVPTVTSGRKTGGQRAFYSGKHKRHGLNVQTVCSPDGELLWAAAPLPGAAADVTAARKAGIAAMVLSVIGVFADLGYLGWDQEVVTGRRKPRGKDLTPAQRAANRLQAQLRCVGERGNARLKYWKVLASELRCRPERCTAMVKAVLALHYMEHDPFAVLRAA
jgi:DDE superfamily endonuclease/Helix-turn-helix of DDE superfamily endonuclease